MKRYLVRLSRSMWGVALDQLDYESEDDAIAAIEAASRNRFSRGQRGTHQAGWGYVTLHGTRSSGIGMTGMPPMNYDPSLVAMIYEIDVEEGQTALDVYHAWAVEQEQIESEARDRELQSMKQRGLENLPVSFERNLILRIYEDTEGYEQHRLYINDDWNDLEGEIIALLGGGELKSTSESIDFGRVRITIERVESAPDDD